MFEYQMISSFLFIVQLIVNILVILNAYITIII